MIPASLITPTPSNLEEVMAFLQAHHGARILAGGHDLLTQMKLRHAAAPPIRLTYPRDCTASAEVHNR